jgi:hypothetical protein
MKESMSRDSESERSRDRSVRRSSGKLETNSLRAVAAHRSVSGASGAGLDHAEVADYLLAATRVQAFKIDEEAGTN